MYPIVTLLGGWRATIFASLAAILLGLCIYQGIRLNAEEEADKKRVVAELRAENELRQWKAFQEEKLTEAYSKIDTSYQKGKQDGKAEADALLASRSAGDVRLRDKWIREEYKGTVPGATPGSSVRITEARPVFSGEDEEFLVRLASEADEVVRQLQACQAITAADREKK